ncbi:MAG TPA: hypothetical protein VN371_08815 [Chlorobaculum sp.]|nr:hypothetical protein [Chlorobaculum sp.]
MTKLRKQIGLVSLSIVSCTLNGEAVEARVFTKSPPQTTSAPAIRMQTKLSIADVGRLKAMIAQHQRIRSKLPAGYKVLLDQLTEQVKDRVFAISPDGNLLISTVRIVNGIVPELTTREATSIAEYCLGGIAGSTIADKSDTGSLQTIGTKSQESMQETQMSFNMQYLQLQSQMQNENRSYTAVSNIMKTKHDTVKNSISNIR